MADHGDNYKRMTGPDGEEIGTLGVDCGHHCGTITVGHANTHTGHCPCGECHGHITGANTPAIVRTSNKGRVPRVI